MKKLQLSSDVINKKNKKFEKKVSDAVDESAKSKDSKSGQKTGPGKSKSGFFQRIKNFFKWIFSIPKKTVAYYKSLSLKGKIVFTAVVSIFILGIGGAISYFIIIRPENGKDLYIPTDRVPAQTAQASFDADISLPLPGAPRDHENPINGELFTAKEYAEMEKRYPIAVMVENHIDARQQSGYNSADIVYETLAEGGITRTMPIFWGHSVKEIGPVRSARQYFVEWLLPYDPLYMHIGYASTNDPRTNAGGTIYSYGVKTLNRSGTFWRVNTKYAPHNAYTSTELLYEKAQDYGYTGNPSKITSWKFKNDAKLEDRGESMTAAVTFFQRLNNGGMYDVTWKYDRNRNVYLRYEANGTDPYTDANTGAVVYAKNVILQRVNATSAYDSGSRMIIDVTSSGDGKLLRDGNVINITWKKQAFESRTQYFDSSGKEIEFNRGTIWVVGVPINQGNVIIGQ